MQKWEYIFLTATWNEGWKVEMVNGDTVDNWQDAPSIYEYVNINPEDICNQVRCPNCKSWFYFEEGMK